MLEYWSIGIMVLEEFYLLKNDSFRFDSPLFHHSTIPLFQMNGMFKTEPKYLPQRRQDTKDIFILFLRAFVP